jgi:hypothetical protein
MIQDCKRRGSSQWQRSHIESGYMKEQKLKAQNWFILKWESEFGDRVREMLKEWSRVGEASAGSDRRRTCWPEIVADLVGKIQVLKHCIAYTNRVCCWRLGLNKCREQAVRNTLTSL